MYQLTLFGGTEPYKTNKKIRLIELFAGIGAQAKALNQVNANFEHYKVIEFNRDAIKSYNAVHGTNFKATDVRKVKGSDLEIKETDKYTYILTYSFPCQDLSKAGTHKGIEKGSGTRSGLLWEVERLLNECDELPQVLVMENVQELLSDKHVKNFGKWITTLEKLGYKNFEKILNARDYNTPQNRERLFMVSVLGNYYYQYPKPVKLTTKASDLYDNEHEPLPLEREEYKLLIKEGEQYYIKQGTASGRIAIKNNGVCCLAWANAPNKRGRVIEDGDIIPALAVTDRSLCKLIDGVLYKLSPCEAWRFMGFTEEDYRREELAGVAPSNLRKQAGNSIAVNVLASIFDELIERTGAQDARNMLHHTA